MKAFSALPHRDVTLQHGDEQIVVRVYPLPIGYHDVAGALLERPQAFVNGKPSDDPKRMPEWEARRLFLLFARALGDQIAAACPRADAKPAEWAAYADAVKAEFEAAHYVEGDLVLIQSEIQAVNRGLGSLGKG